MGMLDAPIQAAAVVIGPTAFPSSTGQVRRAQRCACAAVSRVIAVARRTAVAGAGDQCIRRALEVASGLLPHWALGLAGAAREG